MPDPRKALGLLAGAIGFGVAVDALARLVPARLSAALAVAALVEIVAILHVRRVVTLSPALVPLGPPVALFSLAVIWRDSPTLFALNLAVVAFLLLLATPSIAAVGLRRTGPADFLATLGRAGLDAVTGAPRLVAAEVRWNELAQAGRWGYARGAAVGLAAAMPVLVVFGGLLAGADPIFGRLLGNMLVVSPDEVVAHGVVIALVAWPTAGLLRRLALPPRPAPVLPGGGRWGLAEVGTALAAVNLLFLLFVVVQVRYLFGGDDTVQQVAGLTYAEYARRGFFEVVAVSALSVPLLLLADWWLVPTGRARRRFRVLAGLTVMLLNVMLLSALHRMRLYTAEFGLTELRLYTTAFMGWLALVFAWLAATVLRGRRTAFGSGAVVSGLFVLGALNLLNPDALIVRVNAGRMSADRQFDVSYALQLSADAVPALVDVLPRLPAAERCRVATGIRNTWGESRADHWSISRRRAADLVADDPLRRAAGDCRAFSLDTSPSDFAQHALARH